MAGRRWTPEEIAYVEREYDQRDAAAIAAVIDRTPSAVHNMAQKLGLDWRNPSKLTLNEVMQIVGNGAHGTIRGWVEAGLLEGVHKETGRGRRGEWEISVDGLHAFLRENPHLVDRDKVQPPFRASVPERWVTLPEVFRRGGAHLLLLEHAALAGFMPYARKRQGWTWVVPESKLPELVAMRRSMTGDAEWRRQWLSYVQLQSRGKIRRSNSYRVLSAARRAPRGSRRREVPAA